MKRTYTEPKFLNNGYLMLEYKESVIRKDLNRGWLLIEEMAKRVYPKGAMIPNIKTVLSDFQHWKLNGAQEDYD